MTWTTTQDLEFEPCAECAANDKWLTTNFDTLTYHFDLCSECRKRDFHREVVP